MNWQKPSTLPFPFIFTIEYHRLFVSSSVLPEASGRFPAGKFTVEFSRYLINKASTSSRLLCRPDYTQILFPKWSDYWPLWLVGRWRTYLTPVIRSSNMPGKKKTRRQGRVLHLQAVRSEAGTWGKNGHVIQSYVLWQPFAERPGNLTLNQREVLAAMLGDMKTVSLISAQA